MPGGEKVSQCAPEEAAQSQLGSGNRSLRLEGFSLEVLDAMESDGPAEALEAAVHRYLADRTLRPPGWQCLKLPEAGLRSGSETEVLEIALGEETVDALDAEAAVQGVSRPALAAHALMYVWSAQQVAGREEAATASGRGRFAGGSGDDRSRA
jgi:hypothetical protein